MPRFASDSNRYNKGSLLLQERAFIVFIVNYLSRMNKRILLT